MNLVQKFNEGLKKVSEVLGRYEQEPTVEVIRDLLNPRWIVNRDGELGIRIRGVNFWYYKDFVPLISSAGEYASWREVEKREFGEVIRNTSSSIQKQK